MGIAEYLFKIILWTIIVSLCLLGIANLERHLQTIETVETKDSPLIDYRLEANGKTVDTIFIYKIKKVR